MLFLAIRNGHFLCGMKITGEFKNIESTVTKVGINSLKTLNFLVASIKLIIRKSFVDEILRHQCLVRRKYKKRV